VNGRGPYIASGSATAGDPIRLFSFSSAKCEAVLTVPPDAHWSILGMIFLDNAPLLAAACSDGFIRIWAVWCVVVVVVVTTTTTTTTMMMMMMMVVVVVVISTAELVSCFEGS
jgi:hypothetical protein